MLLKHSLKARLFKKAMSILDLAPDRVYRVLDFGCGKGDFLGYLSQDTGGNSELVGVDAVEKFIVQAKTNYPNVEFICDKFTDNLPLPDASFDIVVTTDTIECITEKDALVSEIHRVLKPLGKVLAMHWDWDTQTYNTESKEIARQAVWAFADWKQPWMEECDGQMGRKLWGLFEGSSRFHGNPDTFCLIETTYEPGKYGFDRMQEMSILVEKGYIGKEAYETLCRELSESNAKGQYFYSVTSFIYYGEKR